MTIEPRNDGELNTVHEIGDAELRQGRDAERLVVRQQRRPQDRQERDDDDDERDRHDQRAGRHRQRPSRITRGRKPLPVTVW